MSEKNKETSIYKINEGMQYTHTAEYTYSHKIVINFIVLVVSCRLYDNLNQTRPVSLSRYQQKFLLKVILLLPVTNVS